MAGIKPKFGDCTKCERKETLLYRRNPPECKTCYQRAKQEVYAKRQKERQKSEPKAVKRINQVSKINNVVTSQGERLTRSEFDNRIRQAKAKKLQETLDKYGYIVCEDCHRNDCKPIDCSHDKSVKACIEDGVPELAYAVENITMRGRACHNIHDKNGIKAK